MKAFLKNHDQTPRKARLVADLVRGKEVEQARAMLSFTDKKSAIAIKILIESAVANAKQAGIDAVNLFIKEIRVDEGLKLRRWRPRERGRAAPFKRRMSKISLTLGEK
ncbi:MAG: 50S ribosomal protein L22 [Candidatus Pacebacteria bacterium]|nr:50S ribosomal protein L22 [Candidatus Paceibacterota bacterium]